MSAEPLPTTSAAEIFQNLSIEDYHARKDVLSKSMLTEFMDCPARFKYFYLDGAAQEEADHLNIGNAVHTLALEPDLFKERYFILPPDVRRDKRSKTYQALLQEAGDKVILREQDVVDIRGMAESLTKNKKALALLDAEGFIESSIFWTDPETGLKLRCRPDLMRKDGLIIDLKTTHSVKPEVFQKCAFDKHYDVSVALTSEGYTALQGDLPENYVFLAIETKPPYLVEAYDAYRPYDEKTSFADVGRHRLRETLTRFVECKKHNRWPSYNDGITPLGVPYYARKQFEKEAQS